MKITNVKIDICNWETEPWRVGSGMRFGGARQLGVVTVETDGGVSGHSFLSRPEHNAQSLIDVLKPRVLGRDPQDIGAIWADLWKQNRAVTTAVIGAIDIALWDINGKIADQPIHRLLGTCKETVPVYSSTAWWGDGGGVRAGGDFVQGGGLAGAQDSSALRSEVGYRDLPRGARRGGRRYDSDARFDVVVRVRRRGAGGSGD